MGVRRGLLRAGTLCVVAGFAIASCRDPTEVTLVLTTNVPCSTLGTTGTSITVGSPGDIEQKNSPVAKTFQCTPGPGGENSIGTFVIIPNSEGASDAFAVRVVTGVNTMIVDCTPPEYRGCIVERRELTFVPHTPLTLPIAMQIDCLDVPCTEHQACQNGMCVSAMVPDPNACTNGANCVMLNPIEGGTLEAAPPADGPPESARGDAPGADAEPDGTFPDVTTPDVTEMDTTMPEASGPDAPGDGPGSDGSPDARADVAPDGPGLDASPDAPDALPDATGASEGGSPGDGGVLGACISAGSRSGVACAQGTCGASAPICCATGPSFPPVTESCTSASGCNFNTVGPPYVTSLACRSWGDCPAGTVCCVQTSGTAGAAFQTACVSAASCPNNITTRVACQNDCECTASGLMCKAATCFGNVIGTCGGICF